MGTTSVDTMVIRRLETYVEVTLDANGDATAEIGPDRAHDRWGIQSVSLRGNSTVQPTVRVYRAPVSDATFVAATFIGNEDTAVGEVAEVLWPGERLAIVWSNGDVGALQTARLYGQIESA